MTTVFRENQIWTLVVNRPKKPEWVCLLEPKVRRYSVGGMLPREKETGWKCLDERGCPVFVSESALRGLYVRRRAR